MDARWAGWASRLNAIAQNGLTFSHNAFDIERYTSVRNIEVLRGDAMPELSAARVTVEQIARLFAHYRHPEWLADLD
jgi:hypothetical protein